MLTNRTFKERFNAVNWGPPSSWPKFAILMEKQKLLFVTDEIPALTGSGTPMRAGSQIQALSQFFAVTVAVVGHHICNEKDHEGLVGVDLHSVCVSVIFIDKPSAFARLLRRAPNTQFRVFLQALWPTPVSHNRIGSALALLACRLTGQNFDVVHCFRLNTGRILHLLRRQRVSFGRSVLDFDAYESQMAFRSTRAVAKILGKQLAAARWLDGIKWRALERLLIPRFDDVYVCSELDEAKLRRRFPRNRWHVVPNVVADPGASIANTKHRFTFLFVGLLSYPPNIDAIVFFCVAVLPIIRKHSPSPFQILIVGRNPDRGLARLRDIPEVQIIANPSCLAPYYSRADVVIVPLRAGGGTRIKIIEAWSYAVPVVSTTIGAEGLDATHELNILLADDAVAFADQCRRIWVDESVRNRIGAAGRKIWKTKYSPAALIRALKDVYGQSEQTNSATGGAK